MVSRTGKLNDMLTNFNAISEHHNQTKNRQLLNLNISMTKPYQ